jgi:putative transposase
MPRVARKAPGGIVYHCLNRGNNRQAIFHKHGDARAFLELIAEAKARVPMRVLAYCLMSNHWHVALWPHDGGDGDLSAFMAWLGNAHVRRYRRHYHNDGHGHLYQGRFKSFPVEPEEWNFLLVMRYVEANALRAGLVARAEEWKWSSLSHRLRGDPYGLLDPWPFDAPAAADWVEIVNRPIGDDQLTRLRTSSMRGSPMGAGEWVLRVADALGLRHTLRSRGRPRKKGTSRISDEDAAAPTPPEQPSGADRPGDV